MTSSLGGRTLNLSVFLARELEALTLTIQDVVDQLNGELFHADEELLTVSLAA